MQLDTVNWSLAILMSLLVHSMIIMNGGAQMGVKSATVSPLPLITRLTFNKPLDAAVPNVPRLIIKPTPQPVKKVELRPVMKKTAKKKSVEKKPSVLQPLSQQTAPVEKNEPVIQVAPSEPIKGKQVSYSSEGLLQRERQQYLHQLLSHIESFKFYPRAARRRVLEGDVKVSFILLDDGYHQQLSFDGKHSTLVKAARQALEAALPLPAPPENINISSKVEFTMTYSLTH